MLKTKFFIVFLVAFGFCGSLYPQDRGTEVVAISGYGRLQYSFYQARTDDEFAGYLLKIIQSAYASFRTSKVSVECFLDNRSLAATVISAMRNRRANISSTYVTDGEYFVVNYIHPRGQADTYVISEITVSRPRQNFSTEEVYPQRQTTPTLQAPPQQRQQAPR
jgi:hypothetical protein